MNAPDLEQMLQRARDWWATATDAEKEAMLRAQRESWVRSCTDDGRGTTIMRPTSRDPAVILAAALGLPEVKALADLLLEARNDLEVYIGAEYPEVSRERYPSVQRQWHRDMELCRRIDCALAALTTKGEADG